MQSVNSTSPPEKPIFIRGRTAGTINLVLQILEDVETDQYSYIKIHYNISIELFIMKMFMTAFNKVIILECHDHNQSRVTMYNLASLSVQSSNFQPL